MIELEDVVAALIQKQGGGQQPEDDQTIADWTAEYDEYKAASEKSPVKGSQAKKGT